MKKLGIVFAAALVLYVITAVAACLLMPQRIAEAESRNFGVRVAMAKIAIDLRRVEDRIRTLEMQARKKGLSKITETAMILEDAELNRFAREYQGVEWLERENTMLEQVVQSRGRLFSQKKKDEDKRKAHEVQVKNLELRKRALEHRLRSPYTESERESKTAEVEQSLAKLCERTESSLFGTRGSREDQHAKAWAKNEETLVQLAARQKESSSGALVKHLKQSLSQLQWEEREPQRLRSVVAAFDVWPLNRIMDFSAGSEHEE